MSYSSHDVSTLQKSLAPAVYGELDLDLTPERFRTELGENSIIKDNPRIKALLEDHDKVEYFRQLTLMGDPLADAFAAIIPQLGYQKARAMVDKASEEGIAKVPDAPQELVDLMQSMETVPDWVDWNKIEKGCENNRLITALGGEAIMRVAFMMTYVNGYQGLPMVITGALTSDSAAKRMKETTSTFKLATLPGALRRGGEAYQSAVKVRLMHAMVRTSLLKRPEVWDYSVYGTPIPQVDQMGAALSFNFMMAKRALKRGGKFTELEACAVEQARYLAFLLGMHDQFLSSDPKQIVETWNMCQATLRHKFDERGRDLNAATMNAYRRKARHLPDRILHSLDQKATRWMYNRMVGRKTADAMGVHEDKTDLLAFASVFAPIGLGIGALSVLKKLPRGRDIIDNFAIQEIHQQLANEGPAEYRTNEADYNMKSA